jgi:hypothetical protein
MVFSRFKRLDSKELLTFNVDIFLHLFKVSMILAVTLSLIGFFVMLAAVRVEPFDPDAIKQNPHAVIGIGCIMCSVIQPCMAFFR